MNVEPLVHVLREDLVESRHFGAVAICDANGRLLASVGDPGMVVYLRSSAKPFQCLPLLESGAAQAFGFTHEEIALICSSHSGMDGHVSVATAIQEKIGLGEEHLLCGVHVPYHEKTARWLEQQGRQPTPNRNNCSGKHSGMLALAKHQGDPLEEYVSLQHPVQQRILKTFAEMCGIPPGDIVIGVDGCSVPTFGVPLRSAATAYARLMDPSGLSSEREWACREVVQAMTRHPEMVGGPGRFDTRLMTVTAGRLLAKGGAEGYQAIGVPLDSLAQGLPAIGISLKIADGDQAGRASSVAALAVLSELGVLGEQDRSDMAEFDARVIKNHRGLKVGEILAVMQLEAKS
jgi:L-asparaginase II